MADLEAQLATYPLIVPSLLDPAAEMAMFPSMAGVFADLAYHRGGVAPSQQEFVDAVAARHAASHPELFSLFRWPGTEARLQRAYPSFVREAHLALLLEERGLRCWRSEDGDQLDGIDILIVRGRYAIGLSTYVATERGRAMRLDKLRRRPVRGVHLDVPLDLYNAQRVGRFLLYTADHARRIAVEIERLAPGESSQALAPASIEFLPPRSTAWWVRD